MRLIARSAKNAVALVARSEREARLAIAAPASVEIWMHRAGEGIESAQLIGYGVPGQTFKTDYNPQSKDDLVFYLRPRDSINRENISRLIDAPQARFSFANPKDQPESSAFIITTNKNFYALDCTADDLVGTLPEPETCFDWEVTFKKMDSSAHTAKIQAGAGAAIDDYLFFELVNQYDAITLRSDGETWLIKSDFGDADKEIVKDMANIVFSPTGDVVTSPTGETVLAAYG